MIYKAANLLIIKIVPRKFRSEGLESRPEIAGGSGGHFREMFQASNRTIRTLREYLSIRLAKKSSSACYLKRCKAEVKFPTGTDR